jgi:hypothetical protein
MTIQTQLVTLAGSAVALPAPADFMLVRRIYIEPLRSNTHPAYIGTSAVTNDASGTGVIKEMATPPAATVAKDSFTFEDPSGNNTMDPTKIYVHGTSSEKVCVTYWQH